MSTSIIGYVLSDKLAKDSLLDISMLRGKQVLCLILCVGGCENL